MWERKNEMGVGSDRGGQDLGATGKESNGVVGAVLGLSTVGSGAAPPMPTYSVALERLCRL